MKSGTSKNTIEYQKGTAVGDRARVMLVQATLGRRCSRESSMRYI